MYFYLVTKSIDAKVLYGIFSFLRIGTLIVSLVKCDIMVEKLIRLSILVNNNVSSYLEYMSYFLTTFEEISDVGVVG